LWFIEEFYIINVSQTPQILKRKTVVAVEVSPGLAYFKHGFAFAIVNKFSDHVYLHLLFLSILKYQDENEFLRTGIEKRFLFEKRYAMMIEKFCFLTNFCKDLD